MNRIEILNDTNEEIQIKSSNIHSSVTNALRRIALSEIYNFAPNVDSFEIKENTTAIHNEMLINRIALIPMKISENKDPNAYVFQLKVNNSKDKSKVVTTNDIEVKYNDVPVDPKTIYRNLIYDKHPVMILRFSKNKEQKIDCNWKIVSGKGSNHSMFCHTTISTNIPENNNENILTIGSIGIKPAKDILLDCFKQFQILITKARKKDIEININEDNAKMVSFILTDQTETIGNFLQYMIYSGEFVLGQSKTLDLVSYHRKHPLKNEIVINMKLKDDIEIFEEYKSKCEEIYDKYIDKAIEWIQELEKEYKEITK